MKDTAGNKVKTTLHHIDVQIGLTAKIACLSVLVFLATGTPGYALRMTKMPKEIQSNHAGPGMRTISLKLPLLQPEFHWTFMSRKDFLAGKLVLRIVRSAKTNEIVIFAGGQMGEGWEPISFPKNPKAGEIYFGFKSSREYETAPNDQLELELNVKQDLSGIGPAQTGILPAGTYKSHGAYSGLMDEYKIPEEFKTVPKETIDKLRQQMEFTAFLENWQEQWDLRITSDKGWLSPEQQHGYEVLLKQMRKDDGVASTNATAAATPAPQNEWKTSQPGGALPDWKPVVEESASIPTGKLAFVTSKGFGCAGEISMISGHHRTTTRAYTTRELEFLPDGKRILYCANSYDANGIYLYDLAQHTNILIMTNAESGAEASWSPDGARIAFVKYTEGRKGSQIYTANNDGSDCKQLTDGPYYNWTPRWSPDGRKLAFETTRNDNPHTHVAGGYRDIYVMDGNGQNQTNLTRNSYGHHPSWSPDGKSIAYMSRGENGHSSVFVMKDDGSAKQNISKGNTRDSEPAWSPDGRWMAFTRTAAGPRDSEAMDIWIMKSDGTEQRAVTFNATSFTSYCPAWSK
jgi:Tol biopolymer transport system component